jgi:hypothetical protein
MNEDLREAQARAQEALVSVCEVCGVDHTTGSADLSHGIIRLMQHAQDRTDWMEFPINGDMIARQRAGILNTSLLFSTADPEDIDWEYVNANPRSTQ